ncbi:MAG: hypothetical protein J7J31_10640 [Helicobacteraceae bacterium]|nr:hypothetical protein [Helicobacteraceae bacterium]
MLHFTTKIAEYIVKYYNINRIEADMMIEDEYDYIEEEFNRGNEDVKTIVKELISIYMVA